MAARKTNGQSQSRSHVLCIHSTCIAKILTQDERVGAIRKHAKGPRQDDEIGIAPGLVDRDDAEFMIEPLKRPQNNRHGPRGGKATVAARRATWQGEPWYSNTQGYVTTSTVGREMEGEISSQNASHRNWRLEASSFHTLQDGVIGAPWMANGWTVDGPEEPWSMVNGSPALIIRPPSLRHRSPSDVAVGLCSEFEGGDHLLAQRSRVVCQAARM